MDIRFTSLHQIDHAKSIVNEIKIVDNNPYVGKYINKLIEEIRSSPNARKFMFKSETAEIRTAINKLIDQEYKDGSAIIASKLLEVEKSAQMKIAQLNIEIQKGSLFQAIIKTETGNTYLIISKADHNEYLDEVDFELHMGLPWKKRIYKAFIANIEADNSLSGVSIFDTNSSLSRYWWEDFLDLKESHTDSHNTTISLHMLDMKIFNPIKVEFPADHTILRNSTVGYYRSHEEFDLSNFIKDIFENYKPVDSSFEVSKWITKIKEFPTKYDFDSRFTISKKDITQHIKRKIALTDYLDLVINDYIPQGMITSVLNQQGEECIQIKSTTGFKIFKK